MCRPVSSTQGVPMTMPGPSRVCDRQLLGRGSGRHLHRRLQHQILGRIAAEEKLGQHQEIGAERGASA